jgi:hypothetical protein
MSTAFVGELRSRRPALQLAAPGSESIGFRVQVAETWEVVRVVASPQTTVREIKERVLGEFMPDHEYADDFVLKLRGWEMLDESAPLGQSGVVDGSIILLGDRRRRPVR